MTPITKGRSHKIKALSPGATYRFSSSITGLYGRKSAGNGVEIIYGSRTLVECVYCDARTLLLGMWSTFNIGPDVDCCAGW